MCKQPNISMICTLFFLKEFCRAKPWLTRPSPNQPNAVYLGHVTADDEWEGTVSQGWRDLLLWMVQQISQQRVE